MKHDARIASDRRLQNPIFEDKTEAHSKGSLLRCISPVVALSGGSQCGEFTSAFGEAAEVHGRRASAASEAYDPKRKWIVHRSNRG
jgi:hypothetical protein